VVNLVGDDLVNVADIFSLKNVKDKRDLNEILEVIHDLGFSVEAEEENDGELLLLQKFSKRLHKFEEDSRKVENCEQKMEDYKRLFEDLKRSVQESKGIKIEEIKLTRRIYENEEKLDSIKIINEKLKKLRQKYLVSKLHDAERSIEDRHTENELIL
jgi:5'-3' exonuclease